MTDRLADAFARPSLPIVLAVARPVRKKNLSAPLHAFSGDVQLRAMANLVIVAGQHDHATGEEREVLDDLHRLAAQPALRGNVALPPSHTGSDIAALYDWAARGGVFVNPALHEPFGLTLVEAAAMGVPVVATRNGGPVEILANLGHGVLVDPSDPADIAKACRGLLSDRETHRRHASAGRQGVASYCWDAYAEASTRIYRGCSAPGLLACDIDNTLTGCRAGALAFHEWARARELPFIIATGRPFDDARRILAEWNLLSVPASCRGARTVNGVHAHDTPRISMEDGIGPRSSWRCGRLG
jgi:sucrose-phosphate synthase